MSEEVIEINYSYAVLPRQDGVFWMYSTHSNGKGGIGLGLYAHLEDHSFKQNGVAYYMSKERAMRDYRNAKRRINRT
jgi:hypothetical protein